MQLGDLCRATAGVWLLRFSAHALRDGVEAWSRQEGTGSFPVAVSQSAASRPPLSFLPLFAAREMELSCRKQRKVAEGLYSSCSCSARGAGGSLGFHMSKPRSDVNDTDTVLAASSLSN